MTRRYISKLTKDANKRKSPACYLDGFTRGYRQGYKEGRKHGEGIGYSDGKFDAGLEAYEAKIKAEAKRLRTPSNN